MAKRIEVLDKGVLIGFVEEGGRFQDAEGKKSSDILLRGRSFDQIEQLFLKRSSHKDPSKSSGKMYQDGYSFRFL